MTFPVDDLRQRAHRRSECSPHRRVILLERVALLAPRRGTFGDVATGPSRLPAIM